ncbi:MAG: TrmH family RNA methyltransferase, partial [Gammaproteobacteria bacterium]
MPVLHRPAPAWFERLAFVLVRPSHPGNVGAVARAMRTMGLRRLVVVAPRDPEVLTDPEAVARASGADDVLRRAVLARDLSEALAPFTLAVAVSAEAREFGPVPEPPEDVAPVVRAALLAEPQAQAAFVFGTERTGLSVEDALLCQRMCSTKKCRSSSLTAAVERRRALAGDAAATATVPIAMRVSTNASSTRS